LVSVPELEMRCSALLCLALARMIDSDVSIFFFLGNLEMLSNLKSLFASKFEGENDSTK